MEKQIKTNTALAFTALAVAILSLIIAWNAFNRAGQDVLPTVANETREVVREAEQAAEEAEQEIKETAAQVEARIELATRLAAVRAQIVAEEVTDETVEEIREIRREYAELYKEAEGEIKETAAQVDRELEQLESSARTNTAESLQTIQGLLELMRQDVLTDED